MKIQILDLKINNLNSVAKAVSSFGFETEIVQFFDKGTKRADLIVIPGVGHFKKASEVLDSCRFRDMVSEHLNQGMAVIGICLGMQLMMQGSEESPPSSGLGIFPGRVKKLKASDSRVPNVGWNTIRFDELDPFANLVQQNDCFYFTHSYYTEVPKDFIRATSLHGKTSFPAIIKRNNVVGIQFHPEKSGLLGRQLLRKIIVESIEK